MIFDLLARREEYQTEVRHNQHNWELGFAPLARRDQAMMPVIEQLLLTARSHGFVRRATAGSLWPQGKPFAVCLTHDVDQLQTYMWIERWRSLRYHRDAPGREKLFTLLSAAKETVRYIVSRGKQATPPLEQWMEAEDRHGFRSSFMFFGAPLSSPSWEDAFYRHGDRVDFRGKRISIADLIRTVAQEGWDVGLHGSCRSHRDANILATEKARLETLIGQPVTSTRQHHLLYDIRQTPHVHVEAGLQTDSTLGSNTNTEFRCGTCLPFLMYDLQKDQALPLLQVPLVIQDCPLAETMAGDEELMFGRCLELMDRVAAVGGVLTLLWHNQHCRNSVEFRVYERVLAEAARRNAWGCSLQQMDQWWRTRLKEDVQ